MSHNTDILHEKYTAYCNTVRYSIHGTCVHSVFVGNCEEWLLRVNQCVGGWWVEPHSRHPGPPQRFDAHCSAADDWRIPYQPLPHLACLPWVSMVSFIIVIVCSTSHMATLLSLRTRPLLGRVRRERVGGSGGILCQMVSTDTDCWLQLVNAWQVPARLCIIELWPETCIWMWFNLQCTKCTTLLYVVQMFNLRVWNGGMGTAQICNHFSLIGSDSTYTSMCTTAKDSEAL